MASACALAIFSGKIIFNFGVQKRLRAFLNPIFTKGVVKGNGRCRDTPSVLPHRVKPPSPRGRLNSLSQYLTVLPAPSGREPLARRQTLPLCQRPHLRGGWHRAAMTGGVQLFILQNILPAAGFAVVAPVGVIKVCGAGTGRRGRLGFWSAVKGEPGSGAAGFDAEAHP